MANKAKKTIKKPIVNDKESFLDDEKTNKKVIVFIILSIFVVLGLILGSVKYFNNKSKNNEENDEIIEIIKPAEDKTEETLEEEEEKPVYHVVVEDVEEKEEDNLISDNTEVVYSVIFLNANNGQIGETQKVTDLNDVLKPEITEQREGYTPYWSQTCDENNICTNVIKYNKILVTSAVDSYTANLNGNVVEVKGTVVQDGNVDPMFAGSDLRTYVRIKFIAPDGITEDDLANMSVNTTVTGKEGGNTYNGIGILDSSAEEILNGNYYFYLVQSIDNLGSEAPVITIDWGNGEKVTYEIELTDVEVVSYAEYIGIETPTTEDTTGAGDVEYTVDATLNSENDTTLDIEGEVNYYETKTGQMETVGLDSYKNILTLKFTAPEEITDFSDLTVTTTSGTYNGPGILDGENYFYLYQAVDAGTTSNPQIVIDWDGAGSLPAETYTINTDDIRLMPNDKLDATVSDVTDSEYEQNLVTDHTGENIIEVTGDVPIEVDKNIVSTVFKPLEGMDVDKTKVTVTDENGVDVFDSSNLEEDGEGNLSYTHTVEAENNTSAPGVTIDWNGTDAGSEISYTYDFTDANLLDAPVTP